MTLTATVRNSGRSGGAPIGDVTFLLDGTAVLGTVSLSRGKATLRTSTLPLGRDTIRVDYTGNQDFAGSTETVVETVRAHSIKNKIASYVDITPSRQAVSTIIAGRLDGTAASPTDAVTLLAAPTVLGQIVLDPGRPTPNADISGGTRHIRLTTAGTGKAIPSEVAPRKQTVNQLARTTSKAPADLFA